jgi:hypothetical protein
MERLTKLMGLGILGLTLIVGAGISGDAKKDKDKEPTKGKTPNLPAGLSKTVKLSKDQIAKIHSIQIEYRDKIDELDKKIKELKAQEKAEWIKVLTDDQRALYLKGLIGEDAKDKSDKDKDKAKDKDKDKDKAKDKDKDK